MADLKFVDQHNMVACLEKSDENAEFHQIVDFLSTCSINYALTVSPTIYASYIEQFWNTATSKIINSVKQIHAIVDGKAVVISESSVRSDLLFNDEDGVTCLTNDEIFENLALMGYEQLSTKLTFQKAHVPTTYQRQRRTHKRRRTKKDTKLPQTSVPLNLEVDNVIPKEGDDSVERDITTDASLDAAQDSDNIIRTQTTAMPNVDIPQGIDKGGSLRRQDTIREECLSYGDPQPKENGQKIGKKKEVKHLTLKKEITPTKVSQGEEQSQESFEVHLNVLSAAKILANASRERVKTYKSYTRRRRSTVSSRDSIAGGLFSTAEEILSTDERIA
ncbi:hypothetical protein Tco_0764050 [Tanacetum coccineum]